MSSKSWNVAVLGAMGVLWFCGTTQREKPVVGDFSSEVRRRHVDSLEYRAATQPDDPRVLHELAKAYLDVEQPGLAVGSIERAAPALRDDPTIEHLYARALLEQGRSRDALAAERRVLSRCADPSIEAPNCTAWLVASATRRADIIEQLVELGIEDAKANPEASSLAYYNATRRVSLSVTTAAY